MLDYKVQVEKMSSDRCEYCDGEVLDRCVLVRFRYKRQTIYVENVPAWVCSQCGEQYFDAPIYKQLEEIARHRRRIRRTISFPLAVFGAAIAGK